MLKDFREKMRDGKGTIEILHILNKDDMKGKCRMFAKVTIKPGCSIGLHEHIDEEEAYYIIKGTARVNDNGIMKEVKAGDVILTPGGEKHSIENNGDEPLEFIAVILVY